MQLSPRVAPGSMTVPAPMVQLRPMWAAGVDDGGGVDGGGGEGVEVAGDEGEGVLGVFEGEDARGRLSGGVVGREDEAGEAGDGGGEGGGVGGEDDGVGCGVVVGGEAGEGAGRGGAGGLGGEVEE